LTLEERDIFQHRHGLSCYVSDGTKTFEKIALIKGKSFQAIHSHYHRICIKVREICRKTP